MNILQTIWFSTRYLWVPYIVASFILIINKKLFVWIYMSFLAFLIVVPHLITQRAMITMEKGLFLFFAFTAPLIGIAFASIIFKMGNTFKVATLILLAVLLDIYLIFSFRDSLHFSHKWANSNDVNIFLAQKLSPEDKVLVEGGSTSILSGYSKVKPGNFTTFDWFLYEGKSGKEAYIKAVNEGYFKYIELEGIGQQGSTIFSDMHSGIVQAVAQNYQMVYEKNGFVVYERGF